MSEYVLTACSTADLSREYFQKIGVPFICFHYELGGESHPDDLWKTMDPHTFYQRMLDGEESRTSQINMTEYIDFWRPFLEEGKDLIHLTLSSGISGTVNSARAAAEELRKDFPDRTIYVGFPGRFLRLRSAGGQTGRAAGQRNVPEGTVPLCRRS